MTEKQREEQRQKKEKERNYYRHTEPSTATDTWADKFSNYKPQGLPDQTPHMATPQPAQDDRSGRVSSAPVATGAGVGGVSEPALPGQAR